MATDPASPSERLTLAPGVSTPTLGAAGKAVVGVVVGRFQPFHLDHLRYVQAARDRCHHLLIGITNPDPQLTTSDPADPNRSTAAANPLTYYDRFVLIRDTLRADGWKASDYDIVPLPINKPELISGYVPAGATFLLTVYDDWGRKKAVVLRELGYSVVVLWDRPPEEKGLSAGTVRDAIRSGRSWEGYLHPAVVAAATNSGMVDKIRRAADAPGELGAT